MSKPSLQLVVQLPASPVGSCGLMWCDGRVCLTKGSKFKGRLEVGPFQSKGTRSAPQRLNKSLLKRSVVKGKEYKICSKQPRVYKSIKVVQYRKPNKKNQCTSKYWGLVWIRRHDSGLRCQPKERTIICHLVVPAAPPTCPKSPSWWRYTVSYVHRCHTAGPWCWANTTAQCDWCNMTHDCIIYNIYIYVIYIIYIYICYIYICYIYMLYIYMLYIYMCVYII